MTMINKPIVNAPLKKLNSWRVGGSAKQLFKPTSIEELSQFLPTLSDDDKPIWIGLGSNVLIADQGIDNTVILTLGGIAQLELQADNIIRMEAGVTCAKAAKFCVQHDFIDGEFFAGIPGTIGGALAMNAGAFNGETWRYVIAVETIDKRGKVRVRQSSDYTVGYLHVAGPGITSGPCEWFVAAYFKLPQGDGKTTQKNIKSLLKKRGETQPIGLPSCGSVFKNPQGDYAARLIESCDLKGYQIGGAQVSLKHANFIINTGTATAADIADLIRAVQNKVAEVTQINLHTEVRFLGFELN